MRGRLEVVAGGMYSGKSEELLRRVRRSRIAQKEVLLFKHSIDDRYSSTHVVSHDNTSAKARMLREYAELGQIGASVDVLAIDEVQFFTEEIVSYLSALADSGKVVIAAGLDTDYTGEPFPTMARLMAVADRVTKLHAVCVVCGDEASRTYIKEKPASGSKVVVGGKELYEARCRHCFAQPIDKRASTE